MKKLAIDDINDNLITLKSLVNEAFPEAQILLAGNDIIGLKLAETENPDYPYDQIVRYSQCKKTVHLSKNEILTIGKHEKTNY